MFRFFLFDMRQMSVRMFGVFFVICEFNFVLLLVYDFIIK
nr:MAG TPA: hypothetical protein [Caudoviricetes sp.]